MACACCCTCDSSTTYTFSESGIPGGTYCPPVAYGTITISVPEGCTYARVEGSVDDVLLIDGTAVEAGCPASKTYDYSFQPTGDFDLAAGDTAGFTASYNVTVTLSCNPLP